MNEPTSPPQVVAAPAPVSTPSPEELRSRLIEEIARALSLQTDMAKAALAVALQDIELMDRKQLDYGSGNISTFGELGVLVRTSDKMERLKNLFKRAQAGQNPNNESINDNWGDVTNYGIIARLVRLGIWK